MLAHIADTRLNNVKVKRWVVKLLPSVAFILFFILFVHWLKQTSPNQNDGKLRELQQLSSEIPVFPDFREVASHDSSRAIDAGVYKSFRSSAPYEEVKRFYSELLIQEGWSLSGEASPNSSIVRNYDGKELTFRKGDFIIVVEYAGSHITNEQWNYSVSFVWRTKDSPSTK